MIGAVVVNFGVVIWNASLEVNVLSLAEVVLIGVEVNSTSKGLIVVQVLSCGIERGRSVKILGMWAEIIGWGG